MDIKEVKVNVEFINKLENVLVMSSLELMVYKSGFKPYQVGFQETTKLISDIDAMLHDLREMKHQKEEDGKSV